VTSNDRVPCPAEFPSAQTYTSSFETFSTATKNRVPYPAFRRVGGHVSLPSRAYNSGRTTETLSVGAGSAALPSPTSTTPPIAAIAYLRFMLASRVGLARVYREAVRR
jgi:hypothetical protein